MSIGNVKPPVGSVVNWGHPLSNGLVGCWLFNEGGGNTAASIGGINIAGVFGIATKTWDSTGVKFTTSTSGGFSTGIKSPISGRKPVTVFVSVIPYVLDGSGSLFIANDSECILYGSNAGVTFICNSFATNDRVVGGSIIANKVNTLAGTFDGTNLSVYSNGLIGGSVIPTGSYGTGTNFTIGPNSAMGIQTRATICNAMYYNRALSADEIKSLHENPYQMIQTAHQAGIYLPKLTTYGSVRRS